MNKFILRNFKGEGLEAVELGYQIYPGGEVRLDEIPEGYWDRIFAKLHTSDDVMALLMLKDVLDRRGIKDIGLALTYLPYARQDRAVVGLAGNEAFALKVFANLLNSANFSCVAVVDVHSDVSRALINNIEVVEREEIFGVWMNNFSYDSDIALVAPDAGALKATNKIAQKFNIKTVVFAEKQRDMATGKITGTKVHDLEKLEGKHIVVVDDLCDGGATFIGIGQGLTGIRCESLNLVVSHGIFSKGLEELVPLYDTIYSHNTFKKNIEKFGSSGYSRTEHYGSDYWYLK